MKRSFIALFGILLVLFVAITFMKSRTSSDQQGDIPKVKLSDEKETLLLFWEHYRQATNDRLAGHLDSAEVHYQRALQLNRNHEDALYYLGNIHLLLGKYKDAEDAWLRLSRINPNSARAFSQLGSLYLCIDDTGYFDLTAARQAFQQALKINKEETGPLLRLGQIALLESDLSTASYYFDAVKGSNHKSAEAYFYAGFIAWKSGNLDYAAQYFRQSVAISKTPKQNDGIVGEGDTRTGTSLVLQQASCQIFQYQLKDLLSYEEVVHVDQINRKYTRFDLFLGTHKNTK